MLQTLAAQLNQASSPSEDSPRPSTAPCHSGTARVSSAQATAQDEMEQHELMMRLSELQKLNQSLDLLDMAREMPEEVPRGAAEGEEVEAEAREVPRLAREEAGELQSQLRALGALGARLEGCASQIELTAAGGDDEDGLEEGGEEGGTEGSEGEAGGHEGADELQLRLQQLRALDADLSDVEELARWHTDTHVPVSALLDERHGDVRQEREEGEREDGSDSDDGAGADASRLESALQQLAQVGMQLGNLGDGTVSEMGASLLRAATDFYAPATEPAAAAQAGPSRAPPPSLSVPTDSRREHCALSSTAAGYRPAVTWAQRDPNPRHHRAFSLRHHFATLRILF